MTVTDPTYRLRDSVDKNLVLQPSRQKKLHAKAVSVGLESPASILCNELEGAQLQLKIQQRRYDQRFQATPSQLLLQDEVDPEDTSNEDENESMDVFEFDDVGVVM